MSAPVIPDPWAITAAGFAALQSVADGYSPADVRADAWDEYVQKKADERCGLVIEGGIAVQPVSGCIMAGCGPEYEYWCGCFDLDRIRAAVDRVKEDRAITGFILDIDSPGGYSKGMADAILALGELRGARPDMNVAAFCREACSAGYWLAAASGDIHAVPGAEMGSIGVYIVTRDYSKMAEMNGILVRLHTDGKYKGMGTPGVEWSKEWLAWIDERVAEVSAEFKGFIRDQRKGIAEETMQGQSFDGLSGYPSGLVDSTAFRSLDELKASWV